MPNANTFPIAGSIREAMQIVADLPVPAPAIHTYPLNRVARRVLAQDFYASFSVPGFRRSRLDGYAVRSADLAAASEASPAALEVIASVPAGTWPVPDIAAGQCVRIMAGAPLPQSADAVVGFEHAGEEEGRAIFTGPAAAGQAIGSPDIDAKSGDLLLRRGTRLLPVHMGRLASIGTTNVPVFARPRVAVLSTGSELLLSGMPPSPGKIYNTNQSVVCGIL
ncbi:MAG: molybdopterin molybdenumtransferase MoeA, partial [Desulfovibrionaceae bacterium]|nr:molybdopterin molybdenumtransferase MoeA [Desulfovibrionaceae bacterium]